MFAIKAEREGKGIKARQTQEIEIIHQSRGSILKEKSIFQRLGSGVESWREGKHYTSFHR